MTLKGREELGIISELSEFRWGYVQGQIQVSW